MVGAQGYKMVPLSKPGIGQNIALHAATTARTYNYLLSVFTTIQPH